MSIELERHILFRDFLQNHEWASKEYETLKLSIAEEANHNHKQYAVLKETRAKSFVNNIVEKASANKSQFLYANKIMVIGSGGSGKSTASMRLGELLQLPVVHLDALFWNPGWVRTEKELWASKIRELCSNPKWIMDGNYGGTIEYRLSQADTVIFFNISRYVCLYRVLKRALTGKRADSIPGCREKSDYPFLKWIWTYPYKNAPKILLKLNKFKGKRICIIENRKDLNKLYSRIRAERNAVEP